jgi:hypothetical protein
MCTGKYMYVTPFRHTRLNIAPQDLRQEPVSEYNWVFAEHLTCGR